MGCGTGLSLPLLADAVGPTGHVIGIDAAENMLTQARRRVDDIDCEVTLLCGDATDPEDPVWEQVRELQPNRVLFAYSLSLMTPWAAAWDTVVESLGPNGRAAVVDMALPSGRCAVWRPLAWLATKLGGSDPHAHPWRALENAGSDVTHEWLRCGHIQVVAGRPR